MQDEDKLVERCRAGDALAWEALVRRYQGRVYSVCVHYLRDREEARDAAQDVFLKVWRALDTYRGETFLPWLLRMTRNHAIDRTRRRKARPPAEDVLLDDGVELEGRGDTPEDASDRAGKRRLIRRALAKLSDVNREILLLKDIQGLSLDEIARMLGLPLGTVKSRGNRARAELARAVATEPGASWLRRKKP